MRRIFHVLFFFIPISGFSQDTITLPRIIITGYSPEPIPVSNIYSNHYASVVDTSVHPTVTIDGYPDPITLFMANNISYPQFCVDMGITYTQYAIFNVETNGSITNIEFLRKGYDTLNQEVLRVLELMPKFPPSSRITSYIVPFKFILKDAVTRNRRLAARAEMEGDWKCVKRDRNMMEEYYEPDLPNNNIRLSNDSIWYFEYPNQFYGTQLFEVNSDWNTRCNAWFQNDTLVIRNMNRWTGGFHYYVRDTFDQNIIDQLLKDTVYFPSLFGTWYVETERPDDVEYGPPIRIKYPVYVPPVFKFDESDIAGKKMIYLNILIDLSLNELDLSQCYLIS